MSSRDYDYGSGFTEIRRGGHSEYTHTPDLDSDKDFMSGLRRSRRERTDSVTFTPQDTYGEPTHSEAGDSAEEQPYFSTNHHQFESSFRSIRGRERAPLAPRLWDMRSTQEAERESSEQIQQNAYDSEVEMRRLLPEQQELAIIEDILSLLMGVSGRYISFRHNTSSVVWRSAMSVEDALLAPMWINPTLAHMANKILPLVLMHKRVDYFTNVYARRRAGVVNQALCAAISTVLKDYYSMVSTLENLARTSTDTSPYTMQQLWHHIYPHMQTFERIVHLIAEIQVKDLPQAKKAATEQDMHDSDGFTTLADKRPNAGSDVGADDIADDGMARSDYDSNDDDSDSEQSNEAELFVVRGGYTLNIISDMIRLRGGDASSRQLYEFLLSKASVPFLHMLTHWLHTGELEDSKPSSPGGEFMVASDSEGVSARTFIDADALEDFAGKAPIDPQYLSFVSVPELTPVFLRPYAVQIVRTGEYLNILRACGVDLRLLEAPQLGSPVPAAEFLASGSQQHQLAQEQLALNGLLNPQMLMREIERAYLRANQGLIDILFKDGKMMAYMAAIKHYLLFEKSDFLTHFLDLAKFEISRQPKDMSANRLQSFLDLALLNPASVSHDDPLKDIVKVSLESVDLIDTLKIINMGTTSSNEASVPSSVQRAPRDSQGGMTFLGTSIVSDNFLTGDLFIALRLQIPFPLTIVLDKVVLDKYKALSRLLLALKQTEQNLVSSWLINLKLEDPLVDLPSAGGSEHRPNVTAGKEARLEAMRRNVFLRIHTMRHRILISIQQILYYCFWDVIEPQWQRMSVLIKDAKTVDELSKIHMHHLDLMFQQCGLTAPKLPKIIVELLKRANKFTGTVNKLISSNSLLSRAPPDASAAKNTAAGKLLNTINHDSSDPESQYTFLKSVLERLDQLDRYWVEQLKILLKALNHYARKFEESYLNLAVRLDCNRGDDVY
ncbi:gamma tubulin complex Spc97/GCP2 subunit Alp4 [Coemansia thaxteri]|uniref:Spindle pole body component n=1 Tax=Coemansia thaxteri TaxID=2663907 RepID=A0A9W8BFB6_9FUNG|nr:gamma tubulin complex Spc97/GCP2 subunit Alp4 [Coemansia thaxteri]KAJ2479206.1 gamma tubulin complex Spc97/GCP2 subunit Alp4 [Coemansia sp. RSA 2320]